MNMEITTYESKFLGVCSYLANKFGIDATLIRVGWVVAFLLGLGSPIFFYFLAYVIIKVID